MTSPWESWKPSSAIVLTSLKLSVAVTLKSNFRQSSCFSRKTGIQATAGGILWAGWHKANGANELTRPQTGLDVASPDVEPRRRACQFVVAIRLVPVCRQDRAD